MKSRHKEYAKHFGNSESQSSLSTFFDEWEREIRKTDDSEFSNFTVGELKNYLKAKTSFDFPLDLKYFRTKDGKKAILAFYKLKGYEIPRLNRLNEEQERLVNFDRGKIIVNSGPGTGKTTIVVERAARLKKGVLVVSYSNESVKEIYERIKILPGLRGKVGFKEVNKDIVITTLDSLAWKITDQKKSDKVTFEDVIKNASSRGIIPYSFCHLIVDEAQDIDDIRGNLIKMIIPSVESVLIMGDPKQKIFSAGDWYCELWKSPCYETNMYKRKVVFKNGKFEQVSEIVPLKIELEKFQMTVSYRFKNQCLLEIHNELSSKRPEFHAPLKSPYTGLYIKPIRVNNVDELIPLIKSYEPSEVCVVTQSLHRDNVVSKRSRFLMERLRLSGIPCYTRQDGAKMPNSVLFSTVHSVKGKEFSLVVLYCLDRIMPHIPLERALSIEYVANTRAKECCVKFDPVEIGKTFSPVIISLRDIAHLYDFQKLLTTNDYSLETVKIPCVKMNCDPLMVEFTFKTRNLGRLPKRFFYEKIGYTSKEIRGLFNDKQVLEDPSVTEEVIKEFEKVGLDNINMCKACSVFSLLVDQQEKEFNSFDCGDVSFITDMLGYIVDEDPVERRSLFYGYCHVELTEVVLNFINRPTDKDLLDIFLFSVFRGKKAAIYSPATGEIIIVMGNKHPSHWIYIVESFVSIRNQVDLVNYYKNKSGIIGKVEDAYVIDCEFNPFTKEIFDIALIPLRDPFSSIVKPLKISNQGLPFAVEWLSSNGLDNAMEILLNADKNIPVVDNKTIYYYNSKMDTKIFPEMSHVDLRGKLKFDLAKLTDLYSLLIEPIEFSCHIKQHTALGDALILYSLMNFCFSK